MAALSQSVVIVIPSYNDWAALHLLIPRIDAAFSGHPYAASILVVDDASSHPIPESWLSNQQLTLPVSILRLRSNLGHQRAIALGLYHAHQFTDAAAAVVMDGDGEDRAEDVPKLLAEFEKGGRREIVFAARTRRMESLMFQVSYQAYRIVHRLLTGIEVRVGNFSVIPREAISRLMTVADIWNHYAAAVYRARLPRRLLPLARGRRLEGRSHMNFVSLLSHGLSAMSVFSDQISARLLSASAVLIVAGCALVVWLGWTPATIALLALAAQSLTFSALFALTIVSRRSAANFLLLRDAPSFLLGVKRCIPDSIAADNQKQADTADTDRALMHDDVLIDFLLNSSLGRAKDSDLLALEEALQGQPPKTEDTRVFRT
jgi:glycosyltransferase involved in cell wall biosynthesis